MDFGTLKNKFTELYVESHIKGDETGKELYKNFLNVLKESETLKSHFIVYKNLENKTVSNEYEAGEYINENIKTLRKFRGENSVVEESKKLVDLLESNGIELETEPTEFNKSLHTLINNETNINNIDSIHESKMSLIKHLMTDKTPVNEGEDLVKDNIDVDKFLSVATEKYNEKYDTMSEEEKNIVKVIREGNEDNKSDLIKTMSKEVINLVNDRLSEITSNLELRGKLLETKEVVYTMLEETDKSKLNQNIKKLYDIKNIFK